MFYICTNFMESFTAHFLFKKKRIIYLFLLFFVFIKLPGQRHELGLKLGMSNLVGDVGRTNYILQKPFGRSFSEHGIPFYGGLIYRMNFNPYQSVRLDLGFSHIQFDDNYALENYRNPREFFGTNSGADADVVFEYYFLPVNNEQKSMLSPYVFGGIGALMYSVSQVTFNNDFKRDSAGNAIAPTSAEDFNQTATYESGKKIILAIPFGAGLKYKFNYNWALSGEFKFKPTFSDGIDYSMIDEKDIRHRYNKELQQPNSTKSLLQQEPYITEAKIRAEETLKDRNYGNTNSKDWVNSITLGLTYSFGRPPCYCD